jgi:hypothetical protein
MDDRIGSSADFTERLEVLKGERKKLLAIKADLKKNQSILKENIIGYLTNKGIEGVHGIKYPVENPAKENDETFFVFKRVKITKNSVTNTVIQDIFNKKHQFVKAILENEATTTTTTATTADATTEGTPRDKGRKRRRLSNTGTNTTTTTNANVPPGDVKKMAAHMISNAIEKQVTDTITKVSTVLDVKEDGKRNKKGTESIHRHEGPFVEWCIAVRKITLSGTDLAKDIKQMNAQIKEIKKTINESNEDVFDSGSDTEEMADNDNPPTVDSTTPSLLTKDNATTIPSPELSEITPLPTPTGQTPLNTPDATMTPLSSSSSASNANTDSSPPPPAKPTKAKPLTISRFPPILSRSILFLTQHDSTPVIIDDARATALRWWSDEELFRRPLLEKLKQDIEQSRKQPE